MQARAIAITESPHEVHAAAVAGWTVGVRTDKSSVPLVESALDNDAVAVWSFEDPDPTQWLVQGFHEEDIDREALLTRLCLASAAGADIRSVAVSIVPRADWAAESQASFPALCLGTLLVHGSHLDPRGYPVRRRLRIEAGAAFGTGAHATTSGCILEIERRLREHRIRRAIDVGTGTAILAMALSRLGGGMVTATDVDLVACRVAKANIRANRLGHRVRVTTPGKGRVVAAGPKSWRRPADLVVANILAGPLTKLAPTISGALAPGGRLILSGILNHQVPRVRAAYRALGLVPVRERRLRPWSVIVMRRTNRPRDSR